MNKYFGMSPNIFGVVLAILSLVPSVLWYNYFSSFEVEGEVFRVAHTGILSNIYFFGFAVGGMTFMGMSHSLSVFRKKQEVGNAIKQEFQY